MNRDSLTLGYTTVPPEGLARLGPEYRFIDVREADEFAGELGHLEKAELVPLAEILAASTSWDREGPLLMICRSGNRSGQAAATLVAAGFRHVVNLEGGMLAVRARGF